MQLRPSTVRAGADVGCDEDVEEELSAVGTAKRIRHEWVVDPRDTGVLHLILSVQNDLLLSAFCLQERS